MPLLFGLPIPAWQTGQDSNFALLLTRGYIQSLHAGIWFPHWLAEANGGLGSPAFYFYGRLPYLLTALLAIALGMKSSTAILLSLALFRTGTFYSCRFWLRHRVEERAADCGALVFVALPFAMLLNPVTRIGFAETAATALYPLLFLLLDRAILSRRSWSLSIAGLGLVYAALAWTHLLHMLLGFAVTLLYAALYCEAAGLTVNVLGFGLGLLLAAPSILPALTLQPLITPGGWTDAPWVMLENNFLFTWSRFHVYRIHDLDLELYATWLLCAAILVLAWRRRSAVRSQDAPVLLALGTTLAVCLFAITGLSKPIWLLLSPLRMVQFSWRLFPAAMAVAAALVALLLRSRPGLQRGCLRLLFPLVFVQLVLPATGAYLSLSGIELRHHITVSLTHRAPVYVPYRERDQPPNTLENNIVPEYFPLHARLAGWQTTQDRAFMVPPAGLDVKLPSTLRAAPQADGSLTVQGWLPAAGDIVLPTFFFPDVRAEGVSPVSLSPDPRTGLTRVHLPGGPVALRIDHQRPLSLVPRTRVAASLGLLLLLAALGFAKRPHLLLKGWIPKVGRETARQGAASAREAA